MLVVVVVVVLHASHPLQKKKKKTIRQDLTSDMDLSPPLYSLADQLVSESKGSAHSSRKH